MTLKKNHPAGYNGITDGVIWQQLLLFFFPILFGTFFHPKAVGNNKCQAHIQCDSIIMDHAEIGSIPEIRARDLNAAIIHEAAIGRINDEQLLKLRTLGLTEEEAENVIIENFLN